MSPTRKLAYRATALAVSLLTGLVAVEAIVRLVMPQDLGALAPWYESHPVYRFRHHSNIDEMRMWGNAYRLRTNSRGLRADREEPYVSPDEMRVVVHGDSMTFGVGVENEDTFVHRTEQRLRQRFGAIDVLNLGVSAHGPDQEYLFFQEEGRRYSPQICVIAVCLVNDLDDVGRSRGAFVLENDRPKFVPYDPPLAKKLAETALYRWLATRSHALVLARYVLVDSRIEARDIAVRETQPPPMPLALAIYREFVQSIRAAGAVPVLLLLPTKEQIAQRRGMPAQQLHGSPVMLRAALLELCTAHAVACVDAVELLAQSRVTIDELFLPVDDHFSATGHRIVADALEDRLAPIVVDRVVHFTHP